MCARMCVCVCVHYPSFMLTFHRQWGNLKSWYLKTIPQRKRINGIKDMLQSLEMKLEGRHHNGIDDCKNMAKICGHLLGRSFKPFVTGSTDNSHMSE